MAEVWRDAQRAAARFGAQAADYDRYRPRYPSEVFDLVLRESGARSGDVAVEIGAGTGIATLPLTERGLEVTAVEPEAELARLAVAKVGDRAHVVVGRFEDCPLPERAVLVAAFNSWHWLDPAVALDRAARLLEGGGCLALVWTEVIAWGPPEFEERLARLFGAPWPKGWGDGDDVLGPVAADGRFEPVRTFHHPFARTLDAATYVAVSRTYGGSRSDEQYARLARVIDAEFGGSVTKEEDAVVHVVRRARGSSGGPDVS